MLEFIFTIDYEIFGNGEGSLKDHIFEPAKRLQKIFAEADSRLVFFIEAAELEKIDEAKSDPAINDVSDQVKDLYTDGHEIALHLHPQWFNGTYIGGKWILDNSEYNLCILSEARIDELVARSINYLKSALSDSGYKPLSFRAGNWLFQPTMPAAKILYNRGVRIDSSVFKGGLQHQTLLDYRPALNNGHYWMFHEDVNKPDTGGYMTEIPIYTEMVPPWQMATKKRLGIQQRVPHGSKSLKNKVYRAMDLMRFRQPLKLDFCRMTMDELTAMMDHIIQEDIRSPHLYKPIVSIGHTKDLVDFDTVINFISYLKASGIKITTFKDAYDKCTLSP